MHRSTLILPALLLALLAGPACRKQSAKTAAARQDLIQRAKSLIDSLSLHGYAVNYRAAQPKAIRWDLAQQIPHGSIVTLQVPIVYKNALLFQANYTGKERFHIDYITRLIFSPDSPAASQIRVVTDFPDSNYFKDPTALFSGVRFVEDWYGHPIEKLLYTPDGKVKRFIPTNNQPTLAEVVQTCYTITGYNYSPELDETVTWSESAGCSTELSDDGSGDDIGGDNGSSATGASGANGGSAGAFTVLPGTSVIKSIKTYFQCFTNVGGSDHTYTVSVCVAQPDPGTRTPWTASGNGSSGSSGGGNPVNAGHTFLTLTETYGNTTITRNVGFYPATDVNPIDVTSQGTLNDDELDAYNISGSFTVTNAQFFNILNFVSQGNTPGYLYNLNTNNCTTFDINAMAQAGISLPSTIGTWPGGAGDDPGDLGEDLRQNNIPGMTLNLTAGNDASHLNVGQCN